VIKNLNDYYKERERTARLAGRREQVKEQLERLNTDFTALSIEVKKRREALEEFVKRQVSE
jgi:hypothetical protein